MNINDFMKKYDFLCILVLVVLGASFLGLLFGPIKLYYFLCILVTCLCICVVKLNEFEKLFNSERIINARIRLVDWIASKDMILKVDTESYTNITFMTGVVAACVIGIAFKAIFSFDLASLILLFVLICALGVVSVHRRRHTDSIYRLNSVMNEDANDND